MTILNSQQMENQRFAPGDPILIENIVSFLKAKGLFDEFRHECLADVDTKSSYQNMSQRIDGYTTKFVGNVNWNPDLNKNELRNQLRKNIDESGMLGGLGADHVVEQVINPKIGQLILPKIIEVVHQYVKEENDRIMRQQIAENVYFFPDNNDGSSSKPKTPVLDPIADILSFTYSKPKTNSQTVVQKSETALKKGTDVSQKVDKKKEDAALPAKSNEVLPKLEKKEEESVQPVKHEVSVKSDDASQVNALVSAVKSVKISESIAVEHEVVESADNNEAEVKLEEDLKGLKLKKEPKTEEVDSQSDTPKKPLKDEVKLEKKKTEDTKSNDDINSSEDNKTNITPSKTSSHSKSKHEPEKSKKVKVLPSQKSPSSTSDQHKLKFKEMSDSKLQSDKHSKITSSKSSKPSKEPGSSSKSNLSKPIKKEKAEDDSTKMKSSDSQSSKSASSLLKKSSKPSTSKTEHTSSKNKSSDKLEKEKHSKAQISKPKGILPPSSTNADKGSKVMLQSSSSYDSSQSSDFDKSHQATNEDQKKHKHYSKHNKQDGSDEKSITKDSKKSSDSKSSHKTTDQTAFKKHKNESSSKLSFKDKLKEDMLLHDSTKTGSRSNSLSGSTSSSKDAQSDESSENSSKQSEKRKKPKKERCFPSQNIPPPPPPSPPPSDLVATETTSSSPDDTTQDSGTLSSDDESYSEGESSEEGTSGSDGDSDSQTQPSEHCSGVEVADLSEIYDSFLYSSSSSDFEGFCSSPERNKEGSSDLSVSSVHTSDLSSYEDEISAEDLSSEDGPQPADEKVKKKLTLKEAQDLLRSKEAQKSSDSFKETPYEGTLMKEKSSEIALPAPISILPSEEEIAPRQEPRRELRRERKLNPKYASNEYTSIFNSKRTSFITKQMNLSPPKPSSNTSASGSNNTIESTEVKQKEKTITNKTSATTEDITTSNNILHSTPSKKNNNSLSDCKKRTFDEASIDDSSCIENNVKSSSPIKISINIKSPSIKTIENKIAKDLNPNGMKRKFDGTDKIENKRLCIRNSIDKESSKRDENKTFINQIIKKSVLSSNNLHKQKANGDVLKKVDHLRRSSQSKPNCGADKNK